MKKINNLAIVTSFLLMAGCATGDDNTYTTKGNVQRSQQCPYYVHTINGRTCSDSPPQTPYQESGVMLPQEKN